MKELIENTSYKKLALYNKGFTNVTKEDWLNYKQDYKRHSHLLEKEVISLSNHRVKITENYSLKLPNELKGIAEEIENAVTFLENLEDWDSEEGAHYTFSTLKNAATFISDYSMWVLNEYDFVIPTPKIYPGPDGSVDILWKSEKFKLLVNIKPHPDLSATFFGKNDNGEEFVEGQFKIGNINQNIFLVLLEQYK